MMEGGHCLGALKPFSLHVWRRDWSGQTYNVSLSILLVLVNPFLFELGFLSFSFFNCKQTNLIERESFPLHSAK